MRGGLVYDPYLAALMWARQLLAAKNIKEPACFLTFCDTIRDIIRSLPRAKRADKALLEHALHLRKLRDDFTKLVEADPLLLYTPQHAEAKRFHQSLARTRLLDGSNRSSKSMTCNADMALMLTGRHPWRPLPPYPRSGAIVGKSYSKYAAGLFIPRWLTGEGGNPITPFFPEGGKYFNRFDPQTHTLYLACPECVKNGRPGSCRHPKDSVTLYSDQLTADEMSGVQFAAVHLDEEIDYSFYTESLQRIKTVPHAGIMVSLTPLTGPDFWTEKYLGPSAARGETIEAATGSIPSVERFRIDQFSAGLVDAAFILDDIRQSADLGGTLARVFGLPALPTDRTIFDQEALYTLQAAARPGLECCLDPIQNRQPLTDDDLRLGRYSEVAVSQRSRGMWTVWGGVDKREQYVIGADVAQGLAGRDYSAAQVLRMDPDGAAINFSQVALLHRWITPDDYAVELFKAGLYYNNAVLAVERNGPGYEVIRRLKEMGYPWLYAPAEMQLGAQIEASPETQFGVLTTTTTKPVFVSVLQSILKDAVTSPSRLLISCQDTLRELRNFIQDEKRAGVFHAAGSGHDDLVMSLAIALYVAVTGHIFDMGRWAKTHVSKESQLDGLDDRSKEFWKDTLAQWYPRGGAEDDGDCF